MDKWANKDNVGMYLVTTIDEFKKLIISCIQEESQKQEGKGGEKDERPLSVADELLSISEFATYMKVSENSVRNWIKQKLISPIRIGKVIRIRKAEIYDIQKKRENRYRQRRM